MHRGVACQSTEGKECGYVGGVQGAERISQGGRVIGEDGDDRRAELETTTIVNSLTELTAFTFGLVGWK